MRAKRAEPIQSVLRLLGSPADIPVLGPALERELYYRLLQGPAGGTLREGVQGRKRFSQMRTAAAWISANEHKPLCVTSLANFVGMSVTSFHRQFRAVTGPQPARLLTHIRLIEARRLLASQGTNVTGVELATGTASPSQFSREYKPCSACRRFKTPAFLAECRETPPPFRHQSSVGSDRAIFRLRASGGWKLFEAERRFIRRVDEDASTPWICGARLG